MKKTILVSSMLFALTMSATIQAQDTEKKVSEEGFVFTTVKENPITSVKNQNRAGTCWCYSSYSFLESELLRMGKGEYDLSEMFTVYNTYLDRADAAVRTHGDVSFSQGGSFYDALYGMETFGLVPEEEMRPGMMYADTLSNHTELSALTDAMVAAIAKGKLRKLQSDENNAMLWKKAVAAVHQIYLGVPPEKFTYKGKEYTPKSFFESTGLKASDYVSLTSYTHHPFYTQFPLEIQDNWRHGMSYNLPLDELIEATDHALTTGYTVCWDGDVSERGFSFSNGVAINPEVDDVDEYKDSDRARWGQMTKRDRLAEVFQFKHPYPEVNVTPEIRQQGYESFATTDDHLMHLTGIAKDQNGTKYYITKNSWAADSNKFGGYLNMSESYVRAKTIYVMMHKDGLPKELKKKLGIK